MEAYQQLEQELTDWTGCKHVVACSSGTAALHLALESLRLPQGSEVIIPNFSMIAVARAVSLSGLIPVLVDCDPITLNLDPSLIPKALTDKTRAIIAVHTYGRSCDMIAIVAEAYKYGLYVVEDMAELHGKHPHSLTSAACWSFYKNKVVHGEEGGAVAFHSGVLAKTARSLRCLGFTDAHDFEHEPRGHNYRLANSLASLILDSLTDFDDEVELRRQCEETLNYGLNSYMLDHIKMPSRLSPWVYDMRVVGMGGLVQNELVKSLRKWGGRHGFKPVSFQEEYRRCTVVGGSNSFRASKEVFYLPLNKSISGDEARTIAETILNYVS